MLSTSHVMQGQTVVMMIQGIEIGKLLRGFMVQSRPLNTEDLQVIGTFRTTYYVTPSNLFIKLSGDEQRPR